MRAFLGGRNASVGMVCGLLCLGFAASAQAQLVRRPHVNSVDRDSAVIVFQTESSCDVTVRYGPGGDLSQSATGASGTVHAVTLERLSPGTSYGYELEACGEVVGDVDTFTTAPNARDYSVHFAVNGDMGTGRTAQTEVAAAIHAAGPELMITVGDNAYSSGTAGEYTSNFFKPMAEMLEDVPIFPTLGNHEYYTSQAQPYLDAFVLPNNNAAGTERYYSFDWGPVHFVSVDSMCIADFDSGSCDGEAHLAWLREDLASTDRPWKVVFMHHPPWSSGEHLSAKKVRERTAPTMEEFGVDVVFTGHDHNFERTHPMRGESVDEENGIPYLVVGSGGASMRDWGESSQPSWSAYRNNSDHGYLDVQVEGGTFTGRFVTTTGEVLDTFTLQKEVALPEPPAVTITAEPPRAEAPLRTLLVAQSNLADPEFRWTLPNGESATEAQVRVELTEPGDYTATVTATSASEGVSVSESVVLQVMPAGCEVTNSCPEPPDAGTDGPDSGPVTTADAGPRDEEPDPNDGPPEEGGCGGESAAVLLPLGLTGMVLRRKRIRSA